MESMLHVPEAARYIEFEGQKLLILGEINDVCDTPVYLNNLKCQLKYGLTLTYLNYILLPALEMKVQTHLVKDALVMFSKLTDREIIIDFIHHIVGGIMLSSSSMAYMPIDIGNLFKNQLEDKGINIFLLPEKSTKTFSLSEAVYGLPVAIKEDISKKMISF